MEKKLKSRPARSMPAREYKITIDRGRRRWIGQRVRKDQGSIPRVAVE